MFTLIKCVLGLIMQICGIYLQQKSEKGRELYGFILGMEAVLSGLIIIATA